MSEPVLVVGEGIAGQAVALALLDRGVPVLLVARSPAEHAESTHRHEGLEAALGADDAPARHLDDLVASAGEPARPFLEAMTEAAPELVSALAQLDVPFERTRKGELALSQSPGASRPRAVHAGCLTARHVSRRLSQRLLRHEASGLLEREIGWSLVELLLDDDGHARGAVALSFASGESRAFAATGVCLASGGHAGSFMADTLAPAGLGAVTGLALRHGARVVAPERVSFHPFCYRAGGFSRRLPRRLESLGAELDAGLLDLSKLDRAPLRLAAGPALDAYARATGADPYAEPVAVESAPDRSLGGLWVDLDHATSVPGLYAVGGVTAAYFGEATSPGTPLTAALHAARPAAGAIERYRLERGEPKRLGSRLAAAEKRSDEAARAWLGREDHGEWVEEIAREVRQTLAAGSGDLDALEERLKKAHLGDASLRANSALHLALELAPALLLARRILASPGDA